VHNSYAKGVKPSVSRAMAGDGSVRDQHQLNSVLCGKDSAAELMMEQAPLARFNPSLGARIPVPR
jgi:hypothetical protein